MHTNCLHLTLNRLDDEGWNEVYLYFEFPGSSGAYSLAPDQTSATYHLCLIPSNLLHLIAMGDSNSSTVSNSNIFWSVDICTNHSEPLYHYSGEYLSSMVLSFDSHSEWSLIYSEGLISSPTLSPTPSYSSDIILTITNPTDNLSSNFTSCESSRISSGVNCNLRAAVDYCLKVSELSCAIHLPPLSTTYLLGEILVHLDSENSSVKVASPTSTISIFGHDSTIQPQVLHSYRFMHIHLPRGNSYSIRIYDTIFSHFGSMHLNGGVFSLTQVNNFYLENILFAGNAGDLGGAIYSVNSSDALLDSCHFSKNVATSGGAIYGEQFNERWTLSNSVFLSNHAARSGGAIYILLKNPFWMISDVTFQKNSATNGGVLYAETHNDLWVISDSFFESNMATENGGVFYAQERNLNWFATNSRFISNTGTKNGGGIYVFTNNSGWIITSSEMSDHNAICGGAIYGFRYNHDWILSYVNLISNSARIGGGVYVRKTNKGWRIISSDFLHNSAESPGAVIYSHSDNGEWKLFDLECRLNSAGSGGVIASFSSHNWMILDSYYLSNTVSGIGGAIDAFSSSYWTLLNNVFESNSARFYGGAMFVAYSASWRISSSIYVRNSAKGRKESSGGGIYVQDCRLWSISNTDFVLNVATFGGVIYASKSPSWRIVGTNFFNNSAKNDGGAMYIGDSYKWKFSRSRFISNQVGNAGGVLYQSFCNSTTFGQSHFRWNSAANGGVIYNFKSNLVGRITDSEFISNSARFSGGVISSYLDNSDWTLFNVTFHSNRATSGGVIFSQEANRKWTISLTFFSSNTGQNGGAIYLFNANTDGKIFDSSFAENTASKDGGVIFSSQANSNWAISSSTFSSNIARSNGGVIQVDQGNDKWVIKFSNFSGNIANFDGGVISSTTTNSYWVIQNSRFDFNRAGLGGVISTTQGNIGWKISDSYFLSNLADTYGGAVSVGTICQSWVISNSKFMNNTAELNGGAMYVSVVNKNWILNRTIFSANSGKQKGGGIYLGSQNDGWAIDNMTMKGNEAKEGGGLYLSGASNMVLRNSLFQKQVSNFGGGLALSSSNNVTIIFCNVIENTAQIDGGGIWMRDVDSFVGQNSTFDRNEARHGSGSAVWLSKSPNSELSSSKFVWNIAPNGRGAVYWAYSEEPKGLIASNLFSHNVARVGNDVASSSVSLVFTAEESKKSSIDFISANEPQIQQTRIVSNTSRQYLQLIEFNVLDSYGQLCFDEVNSIVASTFHSSNDCGNSEVLNGEVEITTVSGQGRFEELRAVCGPRGVMNISFTAELSLGASSTSLTVDFLDCSAGEYLQAGRCVTCGEGTFSLSYKSNSAIQCHPGCPVGSVTCYGNSIEVEIGWWREKNSTARIFECPFGKFACNGGEGVGEELCNLGYEGPLCAVCSDGYYFQTSDSTCKLCPSSSLNIFSLLLLIIFGAVVCVAALYVMSSQLDLMDILSDFTVISCFVFVWDHYFGGKCESNSEENQLLVDRLTCKTKIYVSLFQILSSLPFVLNFSFPNLYSRMMSFGSIVNMNFFNDVALSCDYPFDYIDSLLFVTIVPFIFTLFYISIYFTHVKVKKYLHERNLRKKEKEGLELIREVELEEGNDGGLQMGNEIELPNDKSQFEKLENEGCNHPDSGTAKPNRGTNLPDSHDELSQSLRKLYSTYLKIFLFLSYLTLPGISIFIFRTFSCIDLDPSEPGGSYLQADYSISCESERYSWAKSYAIGMIFVYPIGCTGYYYWLLYTHRFAIQQRELPDFPEEKLQDIEPFSFLYSSYEPQYWYWEVIETVRRVILTGVLVMFPEGSGIQLVFAIVITVLFIKLYSYFAPFEDEYVDGDGEFAQFQIAGVFFITLLIQTDALPSVDQFVYDIVLVTIATSIFLLPPLRFFLEWNDRNSGGQAELSLFVKYFSVKQSRIGIEHMDDLFERSDGEPAVRRKKECS